MMDFRGFLRLVGKRRRCIGGGFWSFGRLFRYWCRSGLVVGLELGAYKVRQEYGLGGVYRRNVCFALLFRPLHDREKLPSSWKFTHISLSSPSSSSSSSSSFVHSKLSPSFVSVQKKPHTAVNTKESPHRARSPL